MPNVIYLTGAPASGKGTLTKALKSRNKSILYLSTEKNLLKLRKKEMLQLGHKTT
jgi:adenylate kinase family enzyme